MPARFGPETGDMGSIRGLSIGPEPNISRFCYHKATNLTPRDLAIRPVGLGLKARWRGGRRGPKAPVTDRFLQKAGQPLDIEIEIHLAFDEVATIGA